MLSPVHCSWVARASISKWIKWVGKIAQSSNAPWEIMYTSCSHTHERHVASMHCILVLCKEEMGRIYFILYCEPVKLVRFSMNDLHTSAQWNNSYSSVIALLRGRRRRMKCTCFISTNHMLFCVGVSSFPGFTRANWNFPVWKCARENLDMGSGAKMKIQLNEERVAFYSHLQFYCASLSISYLQSKRNVSTGLITLFFSKTMMW